MSIVTLVVVLLVVGFALYVIKSAPMIDGWIKMVITGIVVLAVLIWVLSALGFNTGIPIHL